MAATIARTLQLQLRAARLKQALPQVEVARRLGVTQQMMAKLERPTYEPSLTQFDRLAGALGLELVIRLRPRKGA